MYIPDPVAVESSYVDFLTTFKEERQMLGYGHYASTFVGDQPDEVIKVGRVDMNSVELDGYLTYLSFVHEDNPMMPRIYNLCLYTNSDGELWYIVQMERLVCHERVNMDARQRALAELFDVDEEDEIEVDTVSTNSHATEIIQILKKTTGVGSPLCNDLHYTNVMWRPCGKQFQMVITDPLA